MKPWILFCLLLIGCNKAEEGISPLPKIEVKGFQGFGKVIVGVAVGSTVTLRNQSSEAIVYALEGDTDFSLVPEEQVCLGAVSGGATCKYKLILEAQVKGSRKAALSFDGEKIEFTASAILPGNLSISPASVNVGTLLAGDMFKFTMTLNNTGDVRVMFPQFSGSSSIGIETQTCGPYIEPAEICTAKVVYQNFVRNPNLNQNISLTSGESVSSLLVSGVIKAGEISGTIGFSSSPTQLTADGSTYSFQTAILTDQYGNQIEDGLEATVSLYNLTDLSGTSESFAVTSSGGRFQGQFRTTLSPGSAVLSINTFTSSGTLNFTVQSP